MQKILNLMICLCLSMGLSVGLALESAFGEESLDEETRDHVAESDEISTHQSARYKDPFKKSATTRKSTPKRKSTSVRRKKRRVRKSSKTLDLSSLDEESLGFGSSASTAGQPVFKFLFDLMLDFRPGDKDLSFSNLHQFFLVEVTPAPNVQFSSEISATPRYYELAYNFSRFMQIRLGRIWVPFGNMHPHNRFGGRYNVTEFKQDNSVTGQFLPDLWTDLGVAMKFNILDQRFLSSSAQVYVVNGFGEFGSGDPLGGATASPVYPGFGQLSAGQGLSNRDNNVDKAIGGRFEATFMNNVTAGASVYSGRYTDEEKESARIFMFGFDGVFRLSKTHTQIGFGFINMTSGLLAPSEKDSFNRGGIYAEAEQAFGQNWGLEFRIGQSQNDDRIIDPSDQIVVGAKIKRRFGMFTLSLQHFRDLNDAPNKTLRSFTGLRFMMFI